MIHKTSRASSRKTAPEPSNVIGFVSQKQETAAQRAARIARITAIIDDPCRGTGVRFAKIA
jgi:hypothetical protein